MKGGIRKDHPSLFSAVLALGSICVGAGLMVLFERSLNKTELFFGVTFLITGLMMVFGSIVFYPMARLGMAIQIFLFVVRGVLVWLGFVGYHTGVHGFMFIGMAVIILIMLRETPKNPLTQIK